MIRKVIITGISGQDGHFLSKILIQNNISVLGLTRNKLTRPILFRNKLIDVKYISDFSFSNLMPIFESYQPTHIVNFAGQSSVKKSWNDIEETWIANYTTVQNIIDVILHIRDKFNYNMHFTQSGSSEMFGIPKSLPLDEESDMNPISPYAKSKFEAFKLCENLTKKYDLKIANLILFNHESPLRPNDYLSQQIVNQVIDVKKNNSKTISVDYTLIERDWSHTFDFMNAIHEIIKLNFNGRINLSSNKSYTIDYFCKIALQFFNIEPSNIQIIARSSILPSTIAPSIRGDNSKLKKLFEWRAKYNFESIVYDLINFKLQLANQKSAQKSNISHMIDKIYFKQ